MQLRRVALRTITIELVLPFHHVGLATVFLDQLVEVIAALAGAPRTLDAQLVELVLDITKYVIWAQRFEKKSEALRQSRVAAAHRRWKIMRNFCWPW